MALVVEDGTGLANAQSYIDAAYADAYFAARGIAAWTGSSTVKEQAILRAMDYIETTKRWLGYREFPDVQALGWPRLYMYDDGVLVEGMPEKLKRATAEYALRALTATLMPDPTTNATGQVVVRSKEKVGPIESETEFLAGSLQTLKPYPAADILLRQWVLTGGRAVRA